VAANGWSFERQQYIEVREGITKAGSDFAGKGPGDIYGAEHLCRLLGTLFALCTSAAMLIPTVSLPELIAQTNMDHQSVNRLREELSKLTNWLGRNALNYFVSEYETPGQEYAEKAKNF
jgi:mortality factor 4-like protein 1